MRIALAGATGGVGTTVTAAAIAKALADRDPDDRSIVHVWAHEVDQLAAVFGHGARQIDDGAELAPRIEYAAPAGCDEVADCGRYGDLFAPGSKATERRAHWSDATVRLLVIRPSYLQLRRMTQDLRRDDHAPTGLVVIEHDGDSLGASDVSNVLEVPTFGRIVNRASIARVVDAGMLAARMPERLAEGVGRMLDHLTACHV